MQGVERRDVVQSAEEMKGLIVEAKQAKAAAS